VVVFGDGKVGFHNSGGSHFMQDSECGFLPEISGILDCSIALSSPRL